MAELKINEEQEVKITRTYDLVGLTQDQVLHLKALLGRAPATGPKGQLNYDLYRTLPTTNIPYTGGYFTSDTRIQFNDNVEDSTW
jgi:hypothetical protein